ncbi:uncharacterized protein C8A04DRAFT_25655 [Dichotomopilus funicola]|uniref:Uncharacterized protein n=1 Tax=Dichotomopilus funicola TaxID=1934379 RepID=A0AAN6V7Q9_9PEZI|nr:hypothetical protein C8A04DRAFT_25655 [Dichotomopilus funicola]
MGYKHHQTPTKARVHGAYEFARLQKLHYGCPFYKNDIFRATGVSRSSGYKILRDYPRTFHNNSFVDETRGRKRKLDDEDLNKIEKLIWEHGLEGKSLPYQWLLTESGIEKEVANRTVLRALVQRGWKRCSTCQKSFVNAKLAEKQCEEARNSAEDTPTTPKKGSSGGAKTKVCGPCGGFQLQPPAGDPDPHAERDEAVNDSPLASSALSDERGDH